MMKLKLTKWMLALSVFVSFTACQKDVDPEATEFASPEYQLADLGELEIPTIEGTPQISDFKVRPTDSAKVKAFVQILKHLNLDQNQRQAVKGFVRQHHACISEHIAKIHGVHKELLYKANAEREKQIKAFHAGAITRTQLEERLSALRATLRAVIDKHEVKQIHLRVLRKCRGDLFASIESILNKEQLSKWNAWKAKNN